MLSDGVPDGGRQVVLAEELALLAIGQSDGRFPAGPAMEAAIAAAILIELRSRALIELRDGLVRLIDRWPTGDAVLDEVTLDLHSTRPRPARPAIAAIARTGVAQTIAERLERRALIRRTRATVLGVIPVRRYEVVPPRLLAHWAIRIRAIVQGEEAPDARERALLPLLDAIRLLPHLVARPDRAAAAALAQGFARHDPLVDALQRQITLVETGDAALFAVTA